MVIRSGMVGFLILLTAAFCGGCGTPQNNSDAPAIPAHPNAPPEVAPLPPTPVVAPELPTVPATVAPPKPAPVPLPAPEAVSLVLPPDPETGKFTRSDSYLNYWSLLAIPTRPEGDAQLLLKEELLPNERSLRPVPGDSRWRIVHMADPAAEGPTLAELVPTPDAVAYLAARLDSSRAWHGLKLHLGGGGLQKLWLNGELLYADMRGARPETSAPEEIPDINLKAGKNILLIKTVRHAPEWELRLRLSAPDGAPFRFAPLAAQ